MSAITTRFEWFTQSPEARDAAQADAVKSELLETWTAVRDRIGADRFDPIFGTFYAGQLNRDSDHAWAQTNAERDSDFVNMTLEIDARELSLNVVGWFDPQLESVQRWLRTAAARQLLRELDGWFLVVFVRTANVGGSGRAVYRGVAGEERERLAVTETSPANFAISLDGMRARLDPDVEKLSIHLRRSLLPAEATADPDLVGTIAAEVEPWLDAMAEVRLA